MASSLTNSLFTRPILFINILNFFCIFFRYPSTILLIFIVYFLLKTSIELFY